MPQAPTVQTCVSAEAPATKLRPSTKLVEGTPPRGLTFHCTDKAGFIYSSSLYICRVVFLLLRKRRGAGLGKLQRARGRSKYYPHPPTPSVPCTAPKAREVRGAKSLHFTVRDTRARATGISCFPCQTATRSFLRWPAPFRPFIPRAPRFQAVSTRENCAHAGGPVW